MLAARLRRSSDIQNVRARRAIASDRLLALRAVPNDLGIGRIAVAGGRDVGTAVRRNRARRRVREAVRVDLSRRSAQTGLDVLVTARRGVLQATAPEIRASVARAIDRALAAP